MATTIDGIVVFCAGGLLSYLLASDSVGHLRAGIFILTLALYEPLLTSQKATLGQWIMRVRVRAVGDLERISIPRAYIRIATKLLLGWVSFISILFTPKRQGVHDVLVGSVVVSAGTRSDTCP